MNYAELTDQEIQTRGRAAEDLIRRATENRDSAKAKVNRVIEHVIEIGRTAEDVDHEAEQAKLDDALEDYRRAEALLTAAHAEHTALVAEAWHRGVAKINASN